MYQSLRPRARGLIAACALTAAMPAFSAMGNTASTFGLLPGDVASAQALSMFNPQASSLYYNPAYLTRDPRGELTLGVLHAEQRLRGKSQGGAAPPIRENNILDDSRSQQQVIALKTNLSSITNFNHPLYFAFIAGIEKYGKEMMAFDSATSMEGQYFQYGRQPLFLNLGGGTQLIHGISVGASAHISLSSEAKLTTSTNLAGDTEYQHLDVSAKPVLRPVLSTSMEWGKLICGHNENCFIGGLETAFTFRGHTQARTTVESIVTIPGTVPEPGLALLVDTLDSYQPDIYAAGVLYHFTDNFRVGLTVERQNWSDLEKELQKDTIKDQANVKLKDITVPRLGVEWAVLRNLTLTAGAAYQESPLKSIQSKDVNYLDSDKYILGVGTSLVIDKPPILAYPVRLDFGYQYQKLKNRDFELTSDRAPANPYETLTAGGDIHVFSGSLTLKF